MLYNFEWIVKVLGRRSVPMAPLASAPNGGETRSEHPARAPVHP